MRSTRRHTQLGRTTSLDPGMAVPTEQVIPPSRLVRSVMRPLTKLLNPLMKTVSGGRHMGMAATVVHTGRRTGRSYATVTGARRSGSEFLIPLTFGTESDWCRNLRAAGGGAVRLDATTYEVVASRVYETRTIRPLVESTYPAAMRTLLKVLGIKAFLRLEIVSPLPTPTGAAPASLGRLTRPRPGAIPPRRPARAPGS